MVIRRSAFAVPIVLLILAGAGQANAEPDGFVTAEGSRLLLDGKEYRAIGVNVPHLHQAYFGTWFHTAEKYGTPERARQAMVDAVTDAGESGMAFIRFFANPGYPLDIDKLYAKDPDQYWRQMDEVFALCRAHGVKLVPSLNCVTSWQPYVNEPGQALLDPASKTHAAAYGYIREFVSRYRDDPLVLMWELGNECMLGADVDRRGRPALPAGCFSEGAPRKDVLTREDSLTWDMLLAIYKEQTAFIKSIDPNHLVTSGDAAVRPECTSRRETFPDFKYRNDTRREWIANNLLSQPEPLDVYSFHLYGKPRQSETEHIATLRSLIRATKAVEAPVFVGELGQMEPSFKEDPEARWTVGAIDVFEEEGASLAALWVWHFNWQPDWTFTSASHPGLAARAAAFNGRWASLE